MHPLHIKLLRDLRRLWAQVLAIALVMAAGVATMIVGAGAYDSLSKTRENYYQTNRFAHVFADVTRAPKSLANEIAAIDGVAAVETRIVKIALTNIDGMKEPGSALLVSLPDYHEPAVNRVHLRLGRLPEPGAEDEAAISEQFAKAHGFVPGSHLKVLINGAQRDIRITGVVLSPEFVYALGPGDIMPDDRRFGIVWMSEKTLAAAYDLEGAFSNVVLRILPGASIARITSALDDLLAPYGGGSAYGRGDQLSNSFLDAELQQLRAMRDSLPPIFLAVAAFLVNMTLTRLIALEREQIGLLKALGYSSWSVAMHYIEFVVLIALVGVVIGMAGGIWLGNETTKLYARYYSFPFLVFSRNPAIYVIAIGVTVAAAVVGAARAVSGAAWLPPAVAMLPPSPVRYRRLFRGVFDLTRLVRQSTVMISRHLLRWPWRTAGGITGVSLAVGVLVASLWVFGAMDFLIDMTFFKSERQDATISFTAPKPLSALFEVQRLPGVVRAEPYRSVGVTLRKGVVEKRVGITGRPPGTDLSRVLDSRLEPVVLPRSGLVISSALAKILHARIGDILELTLREGDRRTVEAPVSAIIEGYLGLSAYMDIDALNQLAGEGAMISGASIAVDATRQDELFTALKSIPSASFIALLKVSLQRFRETLAQNVLVMVSIYVGFAGVIAFGVIYNFARISLSEQGREMASLRVLGFTRGEVSMLLMTEIAIIVVIAQPLGWLFGYGVAVALASAFSTDVYRMPLIVRPEVYAWASLVVITAAVISALVVRRRIDRLDMIAVLKTRE